MTHYETRTYVAWHRHMLMVMIAHLFTLYLRIQFKRLCEVNSVKSFSMIIFNMAVRHKMANRHNYNIAKNVALVKGGIAVNLPLTG